MASNKTKDAVLGDATAAGADEPAPWETDVVTPAGDQEMQVFEAPAENQWRRKLSEHELQAWVAMQAKMNADDSEAFAKSAFAQAANADSLDDLLSGRVDTIKGRETLDVILEVHSIKFMMGDQPDGCPYFAVLDVRKTDNNEREAMSVGGWLVVAQLGRIHYHTVQFPADSQYLVPAGTPGAQAMETFPMYFRLKERPTPKGTMKYIVGAMQGA